MKIAFPVILPKIVIHDVDEAKQRDKELWAIQCELRKAIDRAEQKKNAPAVKMLNRLSSRGKTLYYEYGNYRCVTQKKTPDGFRQKKNGDIAHCGKSDDVERYSTIDRVYILHMDAKPELVYERKILPRK